LIWGVELEGVEIRGPGRICGHGLSRGNGRVALPVGQVAPQPPGHLPDVLEADGPMEPESGPGLEPGLLAILIPWTPCRPAWATRRSRYGAAAR